MNPQQLIQAHRTTEIKNLELLAAQVVEGFIIGLHKSPFHGFSIEFAEHRLYNTGESIRNIDWKVFARNEKLFVKKFEEETNLRSEIILDISSSMYYPSDKDCEARNIYSKIQFAAIASAALIQLLKKQRDAFALSLFNNKIVRHTECRSTTTHQQLIYSYLQEALSTQSLQNQTAASEVLHLIAEKIHKRSLVIIFSDMMDQAVYTQQAPDNLFDALKHLKHNKHEVILFHIYDGKYEMDFNFENRPYKFIDLESGTTLKLNPAEIKQIYKDKILAYKKMLNDKCHQYNISLVEADVNKGFEQILLPYLIKRSKLI
jgi:uncharacterized protein (DUF58 family)